MPRPFDRSRHVALSGEALDGWELKVNAMELVNSGALQSDPWRLVHDWFGLLNTGLRISPVGSSDSHDVARSIVGQARTYVRCGDDQPGEVDVTEAVEGFLKGRVLVMAGLYWPTAKPYQPDSSEWRPYTLGATGAVYVDADATPGFTSARQYAASLVAACGDDYADLGSRLGDYDEAIACQVGAVLRQRGLLSASTLEKLSPACPAPARSALRAYVSELGQNGPR